MHQAAWERNFFGADRRVFLGDGLPVNWTIQRQHFSTFQPVLDFVHALSYVFAAAFAGRAQAEGAEVYQAVDPGRLVGTGRHDSARVGSTLGGVGATAVAKPPRAIRGLWSSRPCVT